MKYNGLWKGNLTTSPLLKLVTCNLHKLKLAGAAQPEEYLDKINMSYQSASAFSQRNHSDHWSRNQNGIGYETRIATSH